MEAIKLGEILKGPAFRDAIHIAVMPVCSGDELLAPGQRIGFAEGGELVTGKPKSPYKHLGIVDPFIGDNVTKGQRFYMFLFPNTITSLRHNWEHPDISYDGIGVGSESERWLRDFAEQVDADYDEMMYVAGTHCREGSRWGDYLCEGGKWEGQGTPEEFWVHFEAVTGKRPTNTEYGNPGIFSCSC